MSNNGGWLKKVLMWDWHALVNDGFPGWEIEKERSPAFVKLTHSRREKSTGVESHDLCVAWDDVAEKRFYQRDWTESGTPSVTEGEVYWSGWWFETAAERDRFVEWVDDRRGDEIDADA